MERIDAVVSLLEKGECIIYPTGWNYAVACSALMPRAIDTICRNKQIDTKKATLPIVCSDLSMVAHYTALSDFAFRTIRNEEYEPATYILPVSKQLPTLFKSRKEVGVRIAHNPIASAIINRLGHPFFTGSLPYDPEEPENSLNPELIEEHFGHWATCIIDAGIAPGGESALVRLTLDEAVLERECTTSISIKG